MQFGDGQLDVIGLGGKHSRAVPIALGGAGLDPRIALGANDRGQLGLDQLLAHVAHGLLDQVATLAGAKGIEQLG